MHPLIIELREIYTEAITRQFAVTAGALGMAGPEWELAQPIDIGCQLFKVDGDVVVHGTMSTALRLTCSRCAEEFTRPLRVALDAIYLLEHEGSSKRAKELEEGEADVYSYAEHVLDLAEMVRDRLFLSIPLQPHCRAGCKGLCPLCGVNRNLTTCQCAQEGLESPFQLLKGLRF